MATRTLNRRSRTRDDEEAYEDEPRGRRRRDEDDEEPPRRGRSRRSSREDDYDEVHSDGQASDSRRSRRSRDEEDEPRSSRSSRSERSSGSRSTGKGWKSFKDKREERSDYVKTYKYEDEAVIMKILDGEPFSVFSEHWLDELQGKKSFVCLGEGECPLCDIGDRARVYILLNVVDFRDPDNPVVKPWKVSQTTADVLDQYNNDKKTAPINRDDLYWSVWKSGGGKKGKVVVHVNPVKARDLEEDWDIEPLTEEELDDFTLFTEDDVVTFSSRKELQAVADELD